MKLQNIYANGTRSVKVVHEDVQVRIKKVM